MTGSLRIQNNGSDELTITSTGAFMFVTSLGCETEYSVTVSEQPVGQNCVISNGDGKIGNTAGSKITDINIVCADDPNATPDAGTVVDAGMSEDAAAAQDAGTDPDASATLDAATPVTDEADEEDPEDCDCNASGQSSRTNSFWTLVLLVGLLVTRRRVRPSRP